MALTPTFPPTYLHPNTPPERSAAAMPRPQPGWFIGRQHLANHFIMTPVNGLEMHVKAYYSILQYNMDYRNGAIT